MLDANVYLEGWTWFALGVGSTCLALASRINAFYIVSIVGLFLALVSAVVQLSLPLLVVLLVASFMLATVTYLRFWYVPIPTTATQNMRKKAQSMMGVKASLQRGIKAGKGRAQIQNALWTVRCDKRLQAGTLVKVVGYNEAELEVEPVAGGEG